jgi:hypothetical protein
MDELMERCVHNIYRSEKVEEFAEHSELLFKQDIRNKTDDEIMTSVKDSHNTLIEIIEQPAIQHDRQINCENNLYLKLLAKATKESDLKFLRMKSLDKYRRSKPPK